LPEAEAEAEAGAGAGQGGAALSLVDKAVPRASEGRNGVAKCAGLQLWLRLSWWLLPPALSGHAEIFSNRLVDNAFGRAAEGVVSRRPFRDAEEINV
jgi:hypothetical protein